jgi:hypothetical protein
MRRLAVLATTTTAVLAAAVTAQASTGTGSVIDVVTGSLVPGTLSIAGLGTALTGGLTLPAAGAGFGSAIPGSQIAVTDGSNGANGWTVTATYSTLPGVTDLGGGNIMVASSGASVTNVPLVGGMTAADVNLTGSINGNVSGYVPLSSPVAVATTTTTSAQSSTGLTKFSTSYKVQVPTSLATSTLPVGGQVTYTVATVR